MADVAPVPPQTHCSTPHIYPTPLPNLWQWRYLIYLFVKRDFSIYFQQTILGPMWYLLQPLASTTVLTIIFGHIAKIPTDSVPPFLFYLLGSVVWGYFSDCFIRTSNTLSANVHEFGNASFPRLTVPLSSTISALIQFAFQAILFVIIALFHSSSIHAGRLLFIVPALIPLMLTGMGGGMLVAALTTRFRDLTHLLGLGMQLLYFCTPVVYPFSMVPPAWRQVYFLNPLTTVTEMFRYIFFGTTTITLAGIVTGFIISLLIFLIGLIIFNSIEKTYIDTI